MKKRGRPRSAGETVQVAFRLPSELVATLDSYVIALKERTPGLTVTRADAVRMLLAHGLEQAGFPLKRKG